MTNKTKILTVRLPNEVKDGLSDIDMRKFLQSVYDLRRLEIIDIIDNELVIPDSDEVVSERFEDIP